MGTAATQLLPTTATAAQLLPTTTADAATTTVPDAGKKTRQRRGHCGARLLGLRHRAIHSRAYPRGSRVEWRGWVFHHRLVPAQHSRVRAAYYRRREALNARRITPLAWRLKRQSRRGRRKDLRLAAFLRSCAFHAP